MSQVLYSIWAQTKYLKEADVDMWENVIFPTDWKIPLFKEYYTHDLYCDAIMLDTMNRGLIYNDPQWTKYALEVWSKKRYPIWKQLADTMEYEYDPIENYNRGEEWHDWGTHNIKLHSEGKSTDKGKISVYNKEQYERDLKDELDGTVDTKTLQTAASFNIRQGTEPNIDPDDIFKAQLYPQQGMKEHQKTDNTTTLTGDATTTDDGFNERNLTYEFGNDGSDKKRYEDKHTGRVRGNIGVTSTQTLIEQQRQIVKFDIVQFIVQDFIDTFCIVV